MVPHISPNLPWINASVVLQQGPDIGLNICSKQFSSSVPKISCWQWGGNFNLNVKSGLINPDNWGSFPKLVSTIIVKLQPPVNTRKKLGTCSPLVNINPIIHPNYKIRIINPMKICPCISTNTAHANNRCGKPNHHISSSPTMFCFDWGFHIKWAFPSIHLPPNRPFNFRVFHEVNHPTIKNFMTMKTSM